MYKKNARQPDTPDHHADAPTTREAFGHWRQAHDILKRTRLGGSFYLLAWGLCWGFSNRPGAQGLAGAGVTLLFGGLLAARLLHRLPQRSDSASLRQWLAVHWNIVLATAGSWGGVSSWVLWSPDFASSRLIAIVSTIAFGTAMAFTFAMNPRKALAGVGLLVLPAIATLALQGREQLPLVLTLGVYLLFLLLALQRGHAEYHAHTEMAFELLDQRERFRVLSRTDGLTQLGNRFHFNCVLPVLAATARRNRTQLSLAMFDIDWFKRINDTHGHAAGDACLAAFADWMRNTFRRDGDVIVRLGGEEFGVLMPDTPAAQGWHRAEAFRRQVAQTPVAWRDHRIALSTSGGVGVYSPALDATHEHLVQRVDRALYAAKARGRNQVTVAESTALAPMADPTDYPAGRG